MGMEIARLEWSEVGVGLVRADEAKLMRGSQKLEQGMSSAMIRIHDATRKLTLSIKGPSISM